MRVLCFLLAIAAFAQINSASLTGLVTDSSHAILPHVQIEVLNTDTGGAGYYSLQEFPIGTYKVTASQSGFSTITVHWPPQQQN